MLFENCCVSLNEIDFDGERDRWETVDVGRRTEDEGTGDDVDVSITRTA